jgi:hypothetical protein
MASPRKRIYKKSTKVFIYCKASENLQNSLTVKSRFHGEASKNLKNALTVDFGINSTYLHTHMPKINSSSVKICESSRPLLAQFSPASRQNFSIVTRAVIQTMAPRWWMKFLFQHPE